VKEKKFRKIRQQMLIDRDKSELKKEKSLFLDIP